MKCIDVADACLTVVFPGAFHVWLSSSVGRSCGIRSVDASCSHGAWLSHHRGAPRATMERHPWRCHAQSVSLIGCTLTTTDCYKNYCSFCSYVPASFTILLVEKRCNVHADVFHLHWVSSMKIPQIVQITCMVNLQIIKIPLNSNLSNYSIAVYRRFW